MQLYGLSLECGDSSPHAVLKHRTPEPQHICPACGSPDVIIGSWTIFCNACGHQDHEEELN